jgi:putative sporulation protein YyaC
MQNSKRLLEQEYNNLVYATASYLCEFKVKPVIMCLGTDKVIADSLGPIVGHLLATKYNIQTFVYGKLNRTVNAVNMNTYYEHIKKTHKSAKILVIDAKLGTREDIGNINVSKDGVVPCNSAYLKKIGDVNITLTVLENNFCKRKLMSCTKLSYIYEKAELIAKAIYNAYAIAY